MLQVALHGIQSIGERSFGRGAVVGERSLGYPDAGALRVPLRKFWVV
ncbi:dihydroxyacetone kinase, ATP-dependent [Bacillus cereus]|uniref:Dihydroxyacetone kinase, ATP-dependent n=1 Tax=Bacillus cereus TaxID=1396 RepID=A0A9X0MBK8_BACCE|nr:MULTISPECIES: hypothetical protein [Bacillus cereus group]KXY26749.1 dihydroxyacetone kinase, ATP-dependent [Bacillus cereus]KZD50558.1 Dihydroxyacetone kinase ATP-dependent [Bacillus cereus]MBE4942389.1 dihydroxyacetone kinase, ATP-dependent [Bacillus thuringiensis]MCU5243532.1 dihydroxyacetone kinase, ATP-dependent [Bacillus cereus]MEB8943753.1 dihydroxyacetone kinase, ATP-dependent [Bacillus cereus]